MTRPCILSFFENKYQMELKKECFGNYPFEKTLKEYKSLFLSKLDSVKEFGVEFNCSKCQKEGCLLKEQDQNVKERVYTYLNTFLFNLKSKQNLIADYFEKIIKIYIIAISENRSGAMKQMEMYINNYCHHFFASGTLFFIKPFFRVRKKGNYDASDIHELYHIPFNRRYYIGNQRFSLSGIPLLYVAESLQIALKETDCNIKNANVALFLPKYSENYKKGIYDVTNSIEDSLKMDVKYIIEGCEGSYTNNHINDIIARYVMSQILHFPVQEDHKGTFIQEYVLPQLLMDIVNIKPWVGIIYQSSKSNYKKCDKHNMFVDRNICFKVPMVDKNYNEDLLETFYYATWKQGERVIKYSEYKEKYSELLVLKDIALKQGYNINDYIMYMVQIKLHIEKMCEILGKRTYYRRKDCRIELTLFYKILLQIEPIFKNPKKYGLMSDIV